MKHSRFHHITPLPGTKDVLLYHFFTGALIRLDPVQKRLFDFADELPDDDPFLQTWYKYGFMTPLDETEQLRKFARDSLEYRMKQAVGTLGLTLHVTSLCNFACPYCFQSRRSGHMSREVQDQILRYTEKRLSEGNFSELSVGWFGGEPLLVPDIIDYLGHGFRSLAQKYCVSFTTNIHTNAYLLDQKMVDLLEDIGCGFVLITLDGYGELHDQTRYLHGGGATFARIIDNLSNIRTSMILNIRSNLHKGSAASYNGLCEEIRAIAAKTGNEMRCSPARVHVDRQVKDLTGIEELTAEEYHHIEAKTDLSERSGVFEPAFGRCHIVQPNDYVIDDRGYVFAHCNVAAADESTAFCNITELDESSFDIIEKRHAAFIYENFFPEDDKCLRCEKLPVCMGGCVMSRKRSGQPACTENLLGADAFILKKYQSKAD